MDVDFSDSVVGVYRHRRCAVAGRLQETDHPIVKEAYAVTTKKLILIVVAAVAVIGVIWLISHLVFIGLFAYTSRWEFAAEYEEYASEFNVVQECL